MTDEKPKTPWAQTTAGTIVVQGVITAVVSAFVTWGINQAQNLPWQALVANFLVIAVALFLAVSLLSHRMRRAIYVSPVKWLFGLRIVTAKKRQRNAALEKASEAHFVARVNERAKQLVDQTDLIKRATSQMNELKSRLDAREADVQEQANEIATLRAEKEDLQVRLDAVRDPYEGLPPLEPRWHLIERGWTDPDPQSPLMEKKYAIRNSVPESVAYNVRLESTDQRFDFSDAAAWRDLSGINEGEFRGTLVAEGHTLGSDVMVKWLDKDHQERFTWRRIRSIKEQSESEDSDFEQF